MDLMRDQIADPRHCYVELAPYRLLRHGRDNPEGLAGRPIRFTRVAAESYVVELRGRGVGARIVQTQAYLEGR